MLMHTIIAIIIVTIIVTIIGTAMASLASHHSVSSGMESVVSWVFGCGGAACLEFVDAITTVTE